jgi:hypothetical protein
MNILNYVDCLDHEKSELGEKIYRNDRFTYSRPLFLYLDEDKAKGHHLFRIPEMTWHVFMSDLLVKDLKAAGSRGALWDPPEEIFRPPELFPQLWRDRPRRKVNV